MKKELFIIQSYIPSDENIVYSQIYRIYSFGSKKKKYYFLDIIQGEGVGIGIDDGGDDSIEECLVKFIRVCGTENSPTTRTKVGYFTYDEALEIKQEQYEILKTHLKDEENT